MTTGLILTIVTIAIVAVCIYGIKTKHRILAVILLVLVITVMLYFVSLNRSIIASPLTPNFHGKVIDGETGKPLAGINVKAGWHAASASAGGTSGEYYKIYKTITDINGEFTLPRGVKALTYQFPPLIPILERRFDRVIITIYPSGYDYKVARTHYVNESTATIALEKIKNDKEFLTNIIGYYHGLFLMHRGSGDEISSPDEIKWLKNAYYQFEKLYPYSNEDQPYLREITNMLEAIKQPDCVYILQKILVKYPNNATLVWYANNNIGALKKMYNIK